MAQRGKKRWFGGVKHTAQENDCQKAKGFLQQMFTRKKKNSSQGEILKDYLKQKVNC